MKENTTTITILLTSAVMASLITSIANIVIAIINNYRLASIEKEKRKNTLTEYRYKCLYEMLLKWTDYNTPFEVQGKEVAEIATERIINSFIDNGRKFKTISPLLEEKYKEDIGKINEEGEDLLKKLIDVENEMDKNSDVELSQRHKELFQKFIHVAVSYSTQVEEVIRLQLKELLKG